MNAIFTPQAANIYMDTNGSAEFSDETTVASAERDGSLKPVQTVIEATGGNTGIGLAMVCAQKGYTLVITMAEEILRDFADIGLDYWVTGFGTSGTLKGVARALKAKSPATKVVAA